MKKKMSNSLVLGDGFLICPQNTLHFSYDQFAHLFAKIGQKIKKTFFRSISNCSLNFKPLTSPNYGPSLLFYYTSLSVFVLSLISRDFAFIAYPRQKLWRKNLLGCFWYPKG